MIELSDEEIKRQDFVDNTIFEMIRKLNPTSEDIEWDIEMIGEIRDNIEVWIVDRLKIIDEKSFYPFIEE